MALALLNLSNPNMGVMDSLSRLSHDSNQTVAMNAVLGLGAYLPFFCIVQLELSASYFMAYPGLWENAGHFEVVHVVLVIRNEHVYTV